jgi:hypothetical protein
MMQFDMQYRYILIYIQGRQTSLLSWKTELCPPCPTKFGSTRQMSRVLQSHVNITFLTM